MKNVFQRHVMSLCNLQMFVPLGNGLSFSPRNFTAKYHSDCDAFMCMYARQIPCSCPFNFHKGIQHKFSEVIYDNRTTFLKVVMRLFMYNHENIIYQYYRTIQFTA